MNKKIKLIIFDMDGLIIDTEKISLSAWEKTFKFFSIDFNPIIFNSIIGSDMDMLREIFLKEFDNKFEFMLLLEHQRKEVLNIIQSQGIDIKYGLLELLDYLDKKQIKKAIATSTIKEKAIRNLKLTNLIDKFDYIVCGDEVLKRKPHPDLYLNVYKYFNIPKENIFILEDSLNGLKAASKAGISGIYIPDLVILQETEEQEYVYKKFKNLIDFKKFLEN